MVIAQSSIEIYYDTSLDDHFDMIEIFTTRK